MERLSTSPRLGPAPVAIGLIAAGIIYLAFEFSWRQAALLGVGAAAGLVLYHSAFGFTSAWRALIAEGRGGGVRAQMLMLAVTSAVFLPLLADGQIFGRLVRGTVAPVGVSVLVGAFIFGVGMQLGGGCASGTLYSAGGGSVRMLVTLAAFIAGSVVGVVHMPMWEATPAFAPTTLLASLGLAPAMGGSLLLFGCGRVGVRCRRTSPSWRFAAQDRVSVAPPRTLAARRRRARAGGDQRRDAGDCRQAVGRDIGIRALGIEARRGNGRRRVQLAVLADAARARRSCRPASSTT